MSFNYLIYKKITVNKYNKLGLPNYHKFQIRIIFTIVAICQENILLEQALHTSSPITYKSSITVVKQNLKKKLYNTKPHTDSSQNKWFCLLHRAFT